MIRVDNCLVSEDVIEKAFSCDVLSCKGACCIEGDAGAPLEDNEVESIEQNLDFIKQEMDQEGLETLEKLGNSERDSFDGTLVTTCKTNKECVFVVKKDGILNCAIEIANTKHAFGFPKPISCHLYPVRINRYNEYFALNYHKWSICSDACSKGQEDNIRVYQFAKSALERKFGKVWYENLESAVKEHFSK
ncbi:MAG: DUF3109 family protein [Bacteroidia bacterium]|nr:DUF3109 family protein [Bacteroidia bacterium]NNJ56312.1 DUF3109 family protein [Bacteroidia bacterium]